MCLAGGNIVSHRVYFAQTSSSISITRHMLLLFDRLVLPVFPLDFLLLLLFLVFAPAWNDDPCWIALASFVLIAVFCWFLLRPLCLSRSFLVFGEEPFVHLLPYCPVLGFIAVTGESYLLLSLSASSFRHVRVFLSSGQSIWCFRYAGESIFGSSYLLWCSRPQSKLQVYCLLPILPLPSTTSLLCFCSACLTFLNTYSSFLVFQSDLDRDISVDRTT